MTGDPYRGSDLLWAAAIVVSLSVHAGLALALIRYYDPFGGEVAENFGPREILVSMLAPGEVGLSVLESESAAPASAGDAPETVAPAIAEPAEAQAADLAQAETLQPAEADPDDSGTDVAPEVADQVDAEATAPLTSAEQVTAAPPDTLSSLNEAEAIAPAPDDTSSAIAPEVVETPATPDPPEAPVAPEAGEEAVVAQPLAPLVDNDIATPVAIAPALGSSEITPEAGTQPQVPLLADIASANVAQMGAARAVIAPVQTFTPTTNVAQPTRSEATGVTPGAALQDLASLSPETVLRGSTAIDGPADNMSQAQIDDQLAAAEPSASVTSGRSGVATGESLAPRVMIPKPRVLASVPARSSSEAPVARADDATVRRLISLIRGNFSDTCLLAVPKRTEDGRLLLLAFGAREASLLDLSNTIQENLGAPILTRTHVVNSRQCPALTFLRESREYPTFSLSIELAQPQIESGAVLQGFLNNAAGRYVTFLLIDDNGVVQDLGEYLRYSGGRIKFAIPMRRSGASRDTSQLLVVVASPTRPEVLARLIGQRAEDFFPALKAEIGMSNLVTVLPFDIN